MIEKVNPCHPDKVADRIAGAIVDLEKCCGEKSIKSCYGNCNNCTSRFMFNLGYRKINENEIVISKEEYETLKKFENKVRSGVCFTQKEWFDYANKDSNERTSLIIEAKDQARKETAKEILCQLQGHGTTFVKKWIREKYGVDLGETK